MNKEEYKELVEKFIDNGSEAFDGLKLTEGQMQVVEMAAEDFEDFQRVEELFGSFVLDGKFFVQVEYYDSEGCVRYGQGGRIDFDEKGFANLDENALAFDTQEEAEDWIEKNKDKWGCGEFDKGEMFVSHN